MYVFAFICKQLVFKNIVCTSTFNRVIENFNFPRYFLMVFFLHGKSTIASFSSGERRRKSTIFGERLPRDSAFRALQNGALRQSTVDVGPRITLLVELKKYGASIFFKKSTNISHYSKHTCD